MASSSRTLSSTRLSGGPVRSCLEVEFSIIIDSLRSTPHPERQDYSRNYGLMVLSWGCQGPHRGERGRRRASAEGTVRVETRTSTKIKGLGWICIKRFYMSARRGDDDDDDDDDDSDDDDDDDRPTCCCFSPLFCCSRILPSAALHALHCTARTAVESGARAALCVRSVTSGPRPDPRRDMKTCVWLCRSVCLLGGSWLVGLVVRMLVMEGVER